MSQKSNCYYDTKRQWKMNIVYRMRVCNKKIFFDWFIFKNKQIQKIWMKMLKQKNHIVMNENDWTNNVINFKWFQQFFESYIKITNEYRMLIVDDHDSHITNEIIRFCVVHKIVFFCLFFHFIDFLQFFDVNIFDFFAHYYRKNLREFIRYDKYYNVDVVDFLKCVQSIKHEEMTSKNIVFAWRKTELISFDFEIVLTKFSKIFSKSNISNRTFTSFQLQLITKHDRVIFFIVFIFHNVSNIIFLTERLKNDEIFIVQRFAIIDKLIKITIATQTKIQLHKIINKNMMKLKTKKKKSEKSL